nr:LysR substrate-binding domain-containing protein [Rhizobium leguminosarum]
MHRRAHLRRPFAKTSKVTNQDAKHAMILAGLGWGRLPSWQVERDLREGRLVRLLTKALGRNSQVTAEAYLAHRVNGPFGPVALAFRQALKRHVG